MHDLVNLRRRRLKTRNTRQNNRWIKIKRIIIKVYCIFTYKFNLKKNNKKDL